MTGCVFAEIEFVMIYAVGNLHIVVYDLTAGHAHVSFMRKSYADESEPLYAYERQFSRLHMDSLFATKLE